MEEYEPELMRLDKRAKKKDEARERERTRHIAELRAAAPARAAHQQQEELNRSRAHKTTLAQNAQKLLELLEAQRTPPSIKQFFVKAEFTAYSCSKSNNSKDVWDFIATLERILPTFLQQNPVPAMRLSMEQDKREKRWSIDFEKGAAEVKRVQISQRQVDNFSRSPVNADVEAICLTDVRCYYDEKLGQMRSLGQVEFPLAASEPQKPKKKRNQEQPRQPQSEADVNLRMAVHPPFFAGDFYCVQNKAMIRVKGPPNPNFRNQTEYLNVKTVQDDTPENRLDSIPDSVLGFHVWDGNHVILIVRMRKNIKIFTINTETMLVEATTLENNIFIQSQVAHVADVNEQRLFFINPRDISEYARGPDGFFKTDEFMIHKPFNFPEYGKCFCIQNGQLCVGFYGFVVFYNFDKIRKEIKPIPEPGDQGPAWTNNCDFYVTCKSPSQLIFVDPASENKVLVSSAEGVQMWDLRFAFQRAKMNSRDY